MKEIARDSEKDKPSAFIEAAVQKIIRLAGKHGEHTGPIIIAVGDQPVTVINALPEVIHEKMPDIGELRRMTKGMDVVRYLEQDPNPDPIFYREIQGDPTETVQRLLATRCANPVRRHQLPPLLLVVVKHLPSPHPKPEIPSHALNPAFAKCVGARIVDVSKSAEEVFMTGRAPLWVSLKNLFLLRVSRKGGPMLEPEAEALAEKAFKNQATTSNDAAIKLAEACRSRAKRDGIGMISRAILLEIFPPQFREAAEAS